MISWSYSRLKKFKNCPKRYAEEFIIKSVKYDDTETSLYGKRGHKAIEKNLKEDTPLPEEFKSKEKVIQQFKNIPGEFHGEQQLAITQSYIPTTWFGSDVWSRAIIDAFWINENKSIAVDWKFGKISKDSQQLQISTLILFAHYPVVDRVNTSFVWMQNNKLGEVEKYSRDDIPRLWSEIMPDIRRLEVAHENNLFPPKPSGLCNFCPVEGCSFWRSRDGTGNQKGRR